MIHPGFPGHGERFAFDLERTGDAKASSGVIVGVFTVTEVNVAVAIVECGPLLRCERERDGVVRETGHEAIIAVTSPHSPVAYPQVKPRLGGRRSCFPAREDKVLVVLECAAHVVGNREVGGIAGGCAVLFALEDDELKPKAFILFGEQVAGVVPPLDEFGMWTIVGGKGNWRWRDGFRYRRTRGRRARYRLLDFRVGARNRCKDSCPNEGTEREYRDRPVTTSDTPQGIIPPPGYGAE